MSSKVQKTLENKDKEETFDEKKERLETPDVVYYEFINWIKHMGLPLPNLDLMASQRNSKCLNYLDKEYDSITNELLIDGKDVPDACWLNAPHKEMKKVVMHLDQQYRKYDLAIYAMIPSRNERTNYWHEFIEKNRFEIVDDGFIFYFPVQMRIIFEIDGELAHDKNGKVWHDPNGYKLVIWIPKVHLKTFKVKLQEFYRWYYEEHDISKLLLSRPPKDPIKI